jgi:hypothetical protein
MSLTSSEVFARSKNAIIVIAITKTATFHHRVKVAVAKSVLLLKNVLFRINLYQKNFYRIKVFIGVIQVYNLYYKQFTCIR